MDTKQSIECYIIREGQDGSIEVLLLHKPKSKRHLGFWQPITGGIEKGESPNEACIREIFEETNISIGLEDIQDLEYTFEFIVDDINIKLKKWLFLCKDKNGIFDVKISEEHDDFMWVKFSEVEGYLYYDSNRNTFSKLSSLIAKV